MPIIADDFHAVKSEDVTAATKPDSDQEWSMYVVFSSGAMAQLKFVSLSARDDFFKNLVTAME